MPLSQVNHGWKPGAVTKKLLRMLNKAKLRKSLVEEVKPTRRAKKQVEEKPTLIVGKRNGVYHVEMQVTNDNAENNDQYKPLVYKIESMNNKTKIKQKERLRRKLVRAAVKEVWSDPFHPEFCEEVCLKAYKEAIGIEDDTTNEEDVENLSNCSCDEEDSISCDSSEIDWEIHFTPPLMSYQANHQQESLLI